MSTLVNTIGSQQGVPYLPATGGLAVGVQPGPSGTLLTSTGTSTAPTWLPPATLALPLISTSTSLTMAVNTIYNTTNTSLITLTLPATAAAGSVIEIDAFGSGLTSVAIPAGVTVDYIGGGVATSAQTIKSAVQGQSIAFRCVVANTTWNIESTTGSWVVS